MVPNVMHKRQGGVGITSDGTTLGYGAKNRVDLLLNLIITFINKSRSLEIERVLLLTVWGTARGNGQGEIATAKLERRKIYSRSSRGTNEADLEVESGMIVVSLCICQRQDSFEHGANPDSVLRLAASHESGIQTTGTNRVLVADPCLTHHPLVKLLNLGIYN